MTFKYIFKFYLVDIELCATKDEFRFVKAQCNEPLTTFMDFIAREKMIDNVCMIIQGSLNGKAPADMQDHLHLAFAGSHGTCSFVGWL